MKNGKKLYNERGITFFHETERYVNNLNIYIRSKNGTNLWDDLIYRDCIDKVNQFENTYTCIEVRKYLLRLYTSKRIPKISNSQFFIILTY